MKFFLFGETQAKRVFERLALTAAPMTNPGLFES